MTSLSERKHLKCCISYGFTTASLLSVSNGRFTAENYPPHGLGLRDGNGGVCSRIGSERRGRDTVHELLAIRE